VQRRAFLAGGSIAAAVGVVAVLAPGLAATREFKTAVGEVRSIPLDDGSVIWLNTASRVRVDYKPKRRGVTLLAGEALFEVAKDQARPFIVAARDADVRAVGTSFTVSRLPGRPVEVLVREGVVELARPRGEPAPRLRLTAGAQAWAPETGALRSTRAGEAAVARAMSWRSGMLDFDGVTLAEAARTFARYSDQRIVIEDPAVAQRSVTGLFASTDPSGFARAVALSLNLRTRSVGGSIYLSR
jgi:transmembrane sensor